MIGIASWVLLWLGGIVALIGSVGLLRFPDFYTRCHAATMTSVGGFTLALLGIALHNPAGVNILKVVFVVLINLLTNPTATHALADAAYGLGIRPVGLVVNDMAGRRRGSGRSAGRHAGAKKVRG